MFFKLLCDYSNITFIWIQRLHYLHYTTIQKITLIIVKRVVKKKNVPHYLLEEESYSLLSWGTILRLYFFIIDKLYTFLIRFWTHKATTCLNYFICYVPSCPLFQFFLVVPLLYLLDIQILPKSSHIFSYSTKGLQPTYPTSQTWPYWPTVTQPDCFDSCT